MTSKLLIAAPLLALATGCALSERDEDGRLRDISPRAMAALPDGVDPALLIRDENGCYGVMIEQSDPPVGFRLNDASGAQICDT
ncbi:hypothetical protein SAMN04490244_101530 [Tranquillimonas rosea]|uniref:Lipoprotein n=1 Tax=Tranquillimonas rosea TaxID=641238 RepID=A0A1H9QA79_9RHOB|nr:hypothetical protein [Tranquillimonas rosea]SER57337.1 hypothetical protein SAMN04490244_101530 [Tranquillimonas rosea]